MAIRKSKPNPALPIRLSKEPEPPSSSESESEGGVNVEDDASDDSSSDEDLGALMPSDSDSREDQSVDAVPKALKESANDVSSESSDEDEDEDEDEELADAPQEFEGEFHTDPEDEDEDESYALDYKAPLLPPELLKSKPSEPDPVITWDGLTRTEKKALRDELGISMRELREEGQANGVIRAGQIAQAVRGVRPADKVAGARIVKRKRSGKRRANKEKAVTSGKQKLMEQRAKSTSGKGSIR